MIVDIVADAVTRLQIAAAYAAALCDFAVYAGLPLAFSLLLEGKRVHLANLSFAEVHLLDPVWGGGRNRIDAGPPH